MSFADDFKGGPRPADGIQELTDARRGLRDLFVPRPWIYWADFLTTVIFGHLCYALVRQLTLLVPGADRRLLIAGQIAAFLAACVLYYRAAMFIHEIVHLPQQRFRGFRVTWNLLCGIPFLMPSFTYYTHLDHHRRRSYGTHEDGEYMALVRLNPWYLALYFGQGLYMPLLAIVRFLVLVPLAWLSPTLREWVYRHASSLVMDPSYSRPLPAGHAKWMIRLQEGCCFGWCLAVLVSAVRAGQWPYPFLLQAYATSVILITMNAIRTAAAHRWQSEGRQMTFPEQMLDSVTIDSDSLLTVIINPVGLRYHALHHWLPSLPYHNLRAAHRRLMAQLPLDAPYRATVEPSIIATLANLLRRKGTVIQPVEAEGSA